MCRRLGGQDSAARQSSAGDAASGVSLRRCRQARFRLPVQLIRLHKTGREHVTVRRASAWA